MLSTVSMRASMMSATRFGRMASARAFSASTSSQASQGRRVGMGMAAMGAVGLFGVAASASQTQTEQAKEESKAALSPKEFRSFKVHSVESLSHNTKFLRFELPSDNHEAGLSVASCLMARAEVDGKAVMRPYTPVSTRDQKGFLDLVSYALIVYARVKMKHKLRPLVLSCTTRCKFEPALCVRLGAFTKKK